MEIHFSKYQGAGNDFIMLDNRDGKFNWIHTKEVQQLCDRKFGIGADGLIKINFNSAYDFEADYYNSDGSKSFCGNGGRCAVSFCNDLGMDVSTTTFLGYDGKHKAILAGKEIQLEMTNVSTISTIGNDYEIHTGSPHYIRFESKIDAIDVTTFGQEIRFSDTYKSEGINVNIVEELSNNQLYVRTYERGVESETMACGTGVTACALAYAHKNQKTGIQHIHVKVLGGELSVKFHYDGTAFTDIWLIGPATFVFEGTIHV